MSNNQYEIIYNLIVIQLENINTKDYPFRIGLRPKTQYTLNFKVVTIQIHFFSRFGLKMKKKGIMSILKLIN